MLLTPILTNQACRGRARQSHAEDAHRRRLLHRRDRVAHLLPAHLLPGPAALRPHAALRKGRRPGGWNFHVNDERLLLLPRHGERHGLEAADKARRPPQAPRAG